ncbi:hypothetical protein OIDMADRAFT_21008, partial [Oidiodendron maius Zn]
MASKVQLTLSTIPAPFSRRLGFTLRFSHASNVFLTQDISSHTSLKMFASIDLIFNLSQATSTHYDGRKQNDDTF